jgi:hypothetical protein
MVPMKKDLSTGLHQLQKEGFHSHSLIPIHSSIIEESVRVRTTLFDSTPKNHTKLNNNKRFAMASRPIVPQQQPKGVCFLQSY